MAKEVKDKNEKKEDLFHFLKIALAIVGLAAVILASYFGFHFGQAVFTDESMTNNRATNISYELVVEKGDKVLKIGRELEKNGIIESGLAFWVQSKLYDCRIETGTYTVNSRNSSKEIIKYLNQEYLKAHQEEEP